MNKAKKLRITSFICVLLILAGLAVASVSRDTASKLLPIVGFLVVIGGFIGLFVIEEKRNELTIERSVSMPIVMELAQIVGRRVAHTYRSAGRGRVSSSDAWCLTFRTSRHGDVELAVPWDVWKENPEGTSGELHYQGRRFISFKRR